MEHALKYKITTEGKLLTKKQNWWFESNQYHNVLKSKGKERRGKEERKGKNKRKTMDPKQKNTPHPNTFTI